MTGRKRLNRLQGGWTALSRRKARLNSLMRARYSANRMACAAMILCGLLAAVMLLMPNCLGIGNDSIANVKMGYYKLGYTDDAIISGDVATNAYFTLVYALTHLEGGREFSLESAMVSLARSLDWLFTRDQLFDIRFLALLYLLLYLPGVFLIAKAALERVSQFSEAAVLTVLGILIFSDISYIAYFNSLYLSIG